MNLAFCSDEIAFVSQIFSTGVDLIATFYGCLYAGCIPITVRPPHPQNLATTLPTVKMIVEVCIRHFCFNTSGGCRSIGAGSDIAR